jgi:hypothetical protein
MSKGRHQRVLGYVITHEIAHVLIPGHPHGVAGLMQPNLDQQVIAHNRLSFESHETQLIRASLAPANSR